MASSPQRPAAPFRADHVGSFVRPTRLREASTAHDAGLATIQDDAVREIVATQHDVGLAVATDGEFRHDSWHNFLENLDGVEVIPPVVDPVTKSFKPRSYRVTGKLRHKRPIEVANFKFLKSVVADGVVPKLTLASPTMLMRGGREGVSSDAYPDLEEFYADIATVYQIELQCLVDAGARYIQIDDTNFAYLCDPKLRDTLGSEALLQRYITLINASLAKLPDSVARTVHACRGNAGGGHAASGGYEPIAEVLLDQLDVHGFFLEYDDERSGGFDPIRFLPEGSGKRIVLGLVSSKNPALEAKDVLKRRIDQAAKFVPIESLCISPQCGFSSQAKAQPIDEDGQRRKLELIVETAREVWGTAA